MAAEYDATEFIDTDFEAHKTPSPFSATSAEPLRAPTREEVDRKVVDAQQKSEAETAPAPVVSPFANMSFSELCKIGLAMTWPLLIIALGALGVFIAILLRH